MLFMYSYLDSKQKVPYPTYRRVGGLAFKDYLGFTKRYLSSSRYPDQLGRVPIRFGPGLPHNMPSTVGGTIDALLYTTH